MLKINKLHFSLILCSLSILIIPKATAQETDILMTNSRSVDKDRYKGIKGNPYLFEDWHKGKIISVDADVIEGVLLNFNGKTEGFEIKKGNNFIELGSVNNLPYLIFSECFLTSSSVIFLLKAKYKLFKLFGKFIAN